MARRGQGAAVPMTAPLWGPGLETYILMGLESCGNFGSVQVLHRSRDSFLDDKSHSE